MGITCCVLLFTVSFGIQSNIIKLFLVYDRMHDLIKAHFSVENVHFFVAKKQREHFSQVSCFVMIRPLLILYLRTLWFTVLLGGTSQGWSFSDRNASFVALGMAEEI